MVKRIFISGTDQNLQHSLFMGLGARGMIPTAFGPKAEHILLNAPSHEESLLIIDGDDPAWNLSLPEIRKRQPAMHIAMLRDSYTSQDVVHLLQQRIYHFFAKPVCDTLITLLTETFAVEAARPGGTDYAPSTPQTLEAMPITGVAH